MSKIFHKDKNLTGVLLLNLVQEIGNIQDFNKQGLIATQLSVLEALVFKVDENIHPWTKYVAENFHPWLLQHMCTVDSVQNTV